MPRHGSDKIIDRLLDGHHAKNAQCSKGDFIMVIHKYQGRMLMHIVSSDPEIMSCAPSLYGPVLHAINALVKRVK
jgi:hypothetical protein